MDQTDLDAVTLARSEVQRMRDAIADAEADGNVEMTVSQFRRLADLMDILAASAESQREGTMRDPRYYVPLDQFRRVQEQAAHWQGEYGRLQESRAFEELLNF